MAKRELHQNLRQLNNWNLLALLHRARWKLLMQRIRLPFPIHFVVTSTLFSFFLTTLVPLHVLSIPVCYGGGLGFAICVEIIQRRWI